MDSRIESQNKRGKMGKLSAIFCLILFGCAGPLPQKSDYRTRIDESSDQLELRKQEINTSKLSNQQKVSTEAKLTEMFGLRDALTEYLKDLDAVNDANRKLNDRYSLANALIGGAAGFTAPAALQNHWMLILPMGLSLWNWIGLGFQLGNVKPALEKGDQETESAAAVRDQMDGAKDAYRELVSEKDSTKIDGKFSVWNEKADHVIGLFNTYLGKPAPPVYIPL